MGHAAWAGSAGKAVRVAAAVVAAVLMAPVAVAQTAAARPGLPSTQVAWWSAASDAEVDRALAQARADRKPVLLYWGATWCPPCNRLKATLFNRQDFANLSRSFVAVHVDGDRPGAQRLGSRFKVSAYPTVVVFSPDGAEITRLPGEVEPERVLEVLQLGMAGGRPVKAVLADALAGRPLQAAEWRLLSFYSWETDDQQLVPRAELPATLARLAAASPAQDSEGGTRLWLKALAASDDGKGLKPDDALRQRVLRVLDSPAVARAQADVLTQSADDLARALHPEPGPARASLVGALDGALQRLQSDGSLSRADRLAALLARVELARLDEPKDALRPPMPAPLLQSTREAVARADREITDGYERQAVITYAAHVLGRAGLWNESDELLKGNLARSHSPYYLMSQLGGNARRQGRPEQALQWYAQAFEKSQGPATRLQWGQSYLAALIDLSPQDARRIEQTARSLLDEAAQDSGAFEARSARSLQRMSQRLLAWNGKGEHQAVLQRLQQQLRGLCPKVEAAQGQREACEALLKPAPAARATTAPA